MHRILIGLLCFFLLDIAVFRSGFYPGVMMYTSVPGWTRLIMSLTRQHQPDPDKDIFMMGDSRVVEGFNVGIANQASGLRFLSGGSPGTTPKTWAYLLDSVDPRADRFKAVVLTFHSFRKTAFQNMGQPEGWPDTSILAPHLSFGAMLQMVLRTPGLDLDQRASRVADALVAARNYRDDFNQLLLHPSSRIKDVTWVRSLNDGFLMGDARLGHDAVMTGLSWDPATHTMNFPERLTEGQRAQLTKEFFEINAGTVDAEDAYLARWVDHVVRHYSGSKTRVILVRVPQTPLPELAHDDAAPLLTFVQAMTGRPQVIVLPENTFLDLEKPEFFWDFRHLNTVGRQALTERLAKEIESHLR